MGCVASRIDKEERVRICKERKRLMKQLLRYRKEFADAQLAYLRSLRNTGVTLRQFTESELLELDETTSGIGFPPSPPPPLPPSPPPPPTFSPDLRKFEDKPPQTQVAVEEIIEVDEHSDHTPPPPVPSSSWEYWDLFGSVSPQRGKSCETVEQVEEEKWEDTNTEFVEDDEEAVFVADEVNLLPKKQHVAELIDDNSSMMSWHTKDTSDMAMVVWSKKTLTGIVKDLDEYFLKASGIGKDIAVFIDIDAGGTFLYQNIKENKRKRSSSAKVFSALTWSWSSKSLQSSREMGDFSGSGEPCKPGAHCFTLQKLYLEEQKLYKDVKNHIAQQLSHLTDQQQNPEPTTESHQQAAGQLQTEVTSWHHSFSKLVKFQREYVRSLCKWTELTACLEDIDSTQSSNSSTVHAILEKWQEALDKLPDKMVSEAIKCLLSAVQSIVVQQQEECNLRKRSEKLGRKLERELILLSEVEMKFAGSFSTEDANPVLASKHPLTIRRAKVEALKILVDDEKAKYVNSVKTTRILIQNNLQTSLPKVFQALMVYSSAYAHSFEVILSNATISECRDMQTAT
ncbi:UNVERIFIED_CONTAM: Nitrate regulatoryprotein [Sesamum radiatum]|uniref:Nitrate regulatoryprotein n=1 Tax=Sesamum radiatum TaxID=300843 RepID=A0AAW2T0T1_SESRA